MNAFREAAAAHSAAVDSVYGERLRFEPRRGAGRMTAGGADPDRPGREIIGAVTRRPVVIRRSGEGAQGSDNIRLADAKWQVSFSAALGLDVRAGDHLIRLDEPGQPTLRLSEALPIPGRAIHPADEA